MKRSRLAILISLAIFSTALTAISAEAAGRSASSIPLLFIGAPLPFKIVFGIVVDVLPADFGLVAALVNGAVKTENAVAAAIEIVAIFDIRLLFMEPPGPLRQIGYSKV